MWKYFAVSPLKSSRLANVQHLDGQPAKRLQRCCKTRWLSSDLAVSAMMTEIVYVWTTLQEFSTERNDAVATGLLLLSKTVEFVSVLYLLSCALPQLAMLSKTFQSGSLDFSHMSVSLSLCKAAIVDMNEKKTATEKLSCAWNDKFSDTLGEFSAIEAWALDILTHEYCTALLKNLDERFPVPKVLEAFSCFDPAYVSDCRATRSNYGQLRLQVLLDQFGSCIGDAERAAIDWPSFVERLATTIEKASLKTTAELCSTICRDHFYRTAYPEIIKLAQIGLTIPLSSAWPERGFSRLKNIKTKNRNRLLDQTTSALLNISVNGPAQLTDSQAALVAEKWKTTKQRRQNKRCASPLNMDTRDEDSEDDEDATMVDAANELEDEIDMMTFLL